jgi:hypothetical protein
VRCRADPAHIEPIAFPDLARDGQPFGAHQDNGFIVGPGFDPLSLGDDASRPIEDVVVRIRK